MEKIISKHTMNKWTFPAIKEKQSKMSLFMPVALIIYIQYTENYLKNNFIRKNVPIHRFPLPFTSNLKKFEVIK